MDVQSYTLTAAQRVKVQAPGRLFMLVSTGGPLDVDFIASGSPTPEKGRSVEAGFKSFPGDWSNPRDHVFDAFVLTSSTNQTVRIGTSFDAADYQRVVGIVQVEQPDAGLTVADQTVGVASAQIAVANASRRKIHVQNTHTAETIRVGPGTVTASRGVQLGPGMSATFETTAAINAIRQGAVDATVAVVEETHT